ncbi:MAG: hypothetical protein QNJ42_02720 [Crocosphaera sp.]|nr:hypothetical protein [Crocosphaera sp.]
MDNRDQLICDAFYDIVSTPITELTNKLGDGIQLTIATYLDTIPTEKQDDYETMAKYIGEFCYQPGNEILQEWLKDIYKTKAGEDLTMGIEKNKSPKPKSMLPREDNEDNEMYDNASRDGLRGLNDWKSSILTQQNNENNTNENPQD